LRGGALPRPRAGRRRATGWHGGCLDVPRLRGGGQSNLSVARATCTLQIRQPPISPRTLELTEGATERIEEREHDAGGEIDPGQREPEPGDALGIAGVDQIAEEGARIVPRRGVGD